MGNDGDLFFLNVQSLRSHHDQMKVLFASLNRQPLVIALCETCLSDNDPLDLYYLDGYQKGVFVNRKNSTGRGLALFIKNKNNFSHEILSNDIKNILLPLKIHKKMILNICLLCRQPSRNFRQFLSQFENLFLDMSSKNTDHSMIVGDMIFDTIVVAGNCHYFDEYQLLLSSFGYSISKSEATRQTYASSLALIISLARFT